MTNELAVWAWREEITDSLFDPEFCRDGQGELVLNNFAAKLYSKSSVVAGVQRLFAPSTMSRTGTGGRHWTAHEEVRAMRASDEVACLKAIAANQLPNILLQRVEGAFAGKPLELAKQVESSKFGMIMLVASTGAAKHPWTSSSPCMRATTQRKQRRDPWARIRV